MFSFVSVACFCIGSPPPYDVSRYFARICCWVYFLFFIIIWFLSFSLFIIFTSPFGFFVFRFFLFCVSFFLHDFSLVHPSTQFVCFLSFPRFFSPRIFLFFFRVLFLFFAPVLFCSFFSADVRIGRCRRHRLPRRLLRIRGFHPRYRRLRLPLLHGTFDACYIRHTIRGRTYGNNTFRRVLFCLTRVAPNF